MLIAKSEKTGKIEQPLLDKPEMDLPTSWYLDTFFLLSGRRNITQTGAELIKLSEIVTYAQTVGTIEDDIKDFCTIICEMDNVYVEHLNKKLQSTTKRASRK